MNITDINLENILNIALASAFSFVSIVAVNRINGLRMLSKMSSFDFAITVALGTLVASTATTSISLTQGIVAVIVLVAMQSTTAWLRKKYKFSKVVDNQPVLLMKNGKFIDKNLKKVTEDDVVAKLREANVLRLNQIKAVVLEITGDISVLHCEGEVDKILTRDVIVN